MELDSQLYVVTGVLSAAILLLLAFTIILAMQLKKERQERIENENRFLTSADPSIHRGEEMQRRGYGMYSGQDPHPHHQQPSGPPPRSSHHTPGSHGSIPSLHSSQYHGMQQQQQHSNRNSKYRH